MNDFVRTRDSKKSLGVGLKYYENQVDFVEFNKLHEYPYPSTGRYYKSYIKRIEIKDLERYSDIYYTDKDNFFHKIFKLACYETENLHMVSIEFKKKNSKKLCFNKKEIENIMQLMGFDPVEFHAINPKLSLACYRFD